jgi:hypothetical protein
MKKGLIHWENELKEWDDFFHQFASELSNAELHSVMGRIQVIDSIINRYEKGKLK